MNLPKTIKAVILDLDGTLLTQELIISEKTRNKLLRLNKEGIHLIIATGRTTQAAILKTKELNISCPMILANGALIFDPVKNDIIDSIEMQSSTVSHFLSLSKELNKSLNIYTPYRLYIEDEKMDLYVQQAGDDKSNLFSQSKIDIENEKILKCEFFEQDCGNDSQFIQFLKEESKKLSEELYITSAHPNYLEILNKDVNKYTAVTKVLEMLNLEEDEVIVFGDSHNDLEMITNLPYSVAMGNASDEIKNVATFITKSNNSDGIAHFLSNSNDFFSKIVK